MSERTNGNSNDVYHVIISQTYTYTSDKHEKSILLLNHTLLGTNDVPYKSPTRKNNVWYISCWTATIKNYTPVTAAAACLVFGYISYHIRLYTRYAILYISGVFNTIVANKIDIWESTNSFFGETYSKNSTFFGFSGQLFKGTQKTAKKKKMILVAFILSYQPTWVTGGWYGLTHCCSFVVRACRRLLLYIKGT